MASLIAPFEALWVR